MQAKVQCKFYHQLLSKLSKFREKGNKKGFRKSHFSFSNFLNFWKLKNRICYHLKPMFLNSYQGCYSIVLLTLIRLVERGGGGQKRLSTNIFCFITFYKVWWLFLKFIWNWYSDFFFQNSNCFLQCQYFFTNSSYFFAKSSIGETNISLTILVVFESRRFSKNFN